MDDNRITVSSILPAIRRARLPILTVGAAYFLAVVVGILMAHQGSTLALGTRDRIVGQANASDPSLIALNSGNRLQAALLDFGANLGLGAIPSTVTGLGVAFTYPIALYRGWIGGIVSVDGQHVSRLADLREAVYYLVTLILQLIPYSLAGGVGVKMGLEFYRNYNEKDVPKWLGVPTQALLDIGRVYLLVVPLFLIASLWEFLMV